MAAHRQIGLIINPIAGMGGAVGLKGTDGPEVLAEARRRGARPRAPGRALAALKPLSEVNALEVLAVPGMGYEQAAECGLTVSVVAQPRSTPTTAADTRAAAETMAQMDVELVVFAGGDGTARDVLAGAGSEQPVLGIPAGVKIHSGVFAISAAAAGELLLRYLSTRAAQTRVAEVMDVDEDAFRAGVVSARLFGYLRVPQEATLVQNPKVGNDTESSAAPALARAVAHEVQPGTSWIFGPGSTTQAVLEALGVESTLLGVDVVRDGTRVLADATEQELLEEVAERPARIVVSPIGGQGHIFGRGNQQISADVIKAVGPENVVVISTPGKLAALQGRPLLVDTDDPELNQQLSGFVRVITGYRELASYRVAA